MFGLNEAPKPADDPVKDVTEATFMADVVEASREAPVVVDFWAPWCGPCKTLGPLLEQAVRGAKGKVRMAKVNVDENQAIAQQLRVQSIPTVYAFHNGQPVDGFQGAVSPAEVKAFVDRLLALSGDGGLGEAIEAAEAMLTEGAAADAAQTFAAILEEEPGHAGAYGGLVRAYLAAGQTDQAEAILNAAPPEIAAAPEVEAARAGLRLARQAETAGPGGGPSSAGRGPSGRPSGAVRARPGASGHGRQRRRGERASGALPPRPRLERRRGQDAALHPFRRDEAAGPGGARRSAPAVLDDLLLTLQKRGAGLSLPLMALRVDLPDTIPVFPLPGALLLPRARLPLHIFEPRYLQMLEDVLKTRERLIGMIQPRVVPGSDEARLQAIGCAGRLTAFSETEDGRYMVTLSGISRFRIVEEVDGFTPYRRARVDWSGFGRDRGGPEKDDAFDRNGFLETLRRFFEERKLSTDWESLREADEELLINSLSMLCPFEPEEKQALLEAPTLPTRRETLVTLIEFALRGGESEGVVQ